MVSSDDDDDSSERADERDARKQRALEAQQALESAFQASLSDEDRQHLSHIIHHLGAVPQDEFLDPQQTVMLHRKCYRSFDTEVFGLHLALALRHSGLMGAPLAKVKCDQFFALLHLGRFAAARKLVEGLGPANIREVMCANPEAYDVGPLFVAVRAPADCVEELRQCVSWLVQECGEDVTECAPIDWGTGESTEEKPMSLLAWTCGGSMMDDQEVVQFCGWLLKEFPACGKMACLAAEAAGGNEDLDETAVDSLRKVVLEVANLQTDGSASV